MIALVASTNIAAVVIRAPYEIPKKQIGKEMRDKE